MDEKQKEKWIQSKWSCFVPTLDRDGPFASHQDEWKAGFKDNITKINKSRVLVVGAGGLGCEILKDLALSGFTDIHVIDLDTIDLSNLNRQFLFRMKDVGKSKAQVAADFIMKRCKGVKVQAYNEPIQKFSAKWYKQFHFVIAGLDNVEARQWLNQTIVDLCEFDDEGDLNPNSVVFFIDGGTEGFNGQARVFVPHVTSCFECSISSMPPAKGYAVCTIKNVPRLPEHCIMYSLMMQWPLLEEFKSATEYKIYTPTGPDDDTKPSKIKLDKDDPHHMTWLMNRAEERAQKFGIKGVNYNLTMQVVKNIIPAIASTNALVSAACVNEVVKLRTACAQRMDNFFMFIGKGALGINTEVYRYQRNPDCAACHKRILVKLSKDATLEELLKQIQAEGKFEGLPSYSFNGKLLYAPKIADGDLKKPVGQLLQPGELSIATGDERVQKVMVFFTDA
jgi:ubiquitin-activating enzyme E1 C